MANHSYPRNGTRTPEARAQREAHWRDVLARCKQSGLTQVEFAGREGVSSSAISWWIREIRRRDGRQERRRTLTPTRHRAAPVKSFVPVRVKTSARPERSPVEVIVSGQVIRVLPDFDPETFRRIVHVLEGWPTLAEVQEGARC